MAFTFGDPRLFTLGAELTLFDRATGNIVAFDNVSTDASINYTFELLEIAGGVQNQLVGLIPHSTRLSGSYTSQAFSLAQRALLSGGELTSGAVAPVCETIKATGTTLTVSKTPALHQAQAAGDTEAWCQVRVHGATSYEGVNYGVNISTKQVQNFTATPDVTYDVFYFTEWASAKQLALPAAANPSLVTVQLKYPVYADKNGAKENGTLAGYLYVVVTDALPNGDAGIQGNPTSNGTTTFTWRALPPDDDRIPRCEDCDGIAGNLAYYVYVPCGTEFGDIVNIVAVGGDMTIGVGADRQLNIRYIMKDGSTAMPDFSELTYASTATAKATVSATGVVHGVATGDSVVTASLTVGGSTLVCKVAVTVVTV